MTPKLFLSLYLILVALAAPLRAEEDPHLWLEEIESPKALDWVRAHNAKSVGTLTGDPRYQGIEAAVRKVVLATDRLPLGAHRNGWVYNFWQDATHVRGIWRRTPLADYAKREPAWQILLDLDKLATQEKENWVWKGAQCLPPDLDRCLVQLSRGGKDAVVFREFDAKAGAFVEGGFSLPEAKSAVVWQDKDHVLVATDFGPETLTLAGYPRQVKRWTRGTPLAQATLLFEGKKEDVEVAAETVFAPGGPVTYINRAPSFFESEILWLRENGKQIKLPFPIDATFRGYFNGLFLAQLRTDWKVHGKTFPTGALLSVPAAKLGGPKPERFVKEVFSPGPREAVSNVVPGKNFLYLEMMENVWGKVLRGSFKGGKWRWENTNLPAQGTLSLLADATQPEDGVFVQYSSFLTPSTLYFYHPATGGEVPKGIPLAPAAVRQLPERFNAQGLVAKQFESTSKDGTKIPYFLVHRADAKLTGEMPTLLYGYGGFELSSQPSYLETIGGNWLEKGGAYAIANIRGGGEFGPRWHRAALLENRQKAFDDFISVAEDLIKRKVTSPRRLGIRGGSNGGLLMGATFTQRPDLFNAVLCLVPLLDMTRYHKLLAGFSWVAEYGNPEDPKMAPIIRAYSPYQNVKPGVKYPKVFFITSTKDDRVHPGHARKMVARMEEQGHSVWLYENIEGGHGAAANLEQKVKNLSLELTYLYQQLMD